MAAAKQQDYYQTLGLKRNAKPDEVRKAYRRLARKYHPDVNPGDKTAEDRFKDIQAAYDVLGDAKKRQMFDRYGFYSDQAFAGGGPGGAGRSPGEAGGFRPGGFDFDGFDFSEFARHAAGGAGRQSRGGFSDLFGNLFGRGAAAGHTETGPKPGEDLEYAIDIDFWEAVRGTTARLSVARNAPCSRCNATGCADSGGPAACSECGGSGHVSRAVGNMRFDASCPRCGGSGRIRNACAHCRGEGRTAATEPVEARIPAGAKQGSRLRVQGKGNSGLRGGPAGDLYIVTRVGEHPFFKRVGDDIRIQVPVTPAEAVLGAKIEVPTIEGSAFLKIPPATSSGKVFRVRERGVLNPGAKRRGDQFVEVRIVVPEIAGEGIKELMRRYAELNPENPREPLFEKR